MGIDRFVAAVLATVLISFAWSSPGRAWGDEGHQIVGQIAQSLLDPIVRQKVSALLAEDTDSLTAHDILDETMWADRYRDADQDGSREHTKRWHFVDIELQKPDLYWACYGQPDLPPGALASNGAALDCVVDKIDQFEAELKAPATDPSERIVALKYLLHFVGDVHQPLHAADDDDRGGNDKRVTAPGLRPANLHAYWDTDFVELMGTDPKHVATLLLNNISDRNVRDWSRGTAEDWAMESFTLAKTDVYGKLPPAGGRDHYQLSDEYVSMAVRDVAVQLSKAGVRLAAILNRAFGGCADGGARCAGG